MLGQFYHLVLLDVAFGYGLNSGVFSGFRILTRDTQRLVWGSRSMEHFNKHTVTEKMVFITCKKNHL